MWRTCGPDDVLVWIAVMSNELSFSSSLTAWPSARYSFFVLSFRFALVTFTAAISAPGGQTYAGQQYAGSGSVVVVVVVVVGGG